MLLQGLRVFGAVGAYSWSGGIVQDLSHQLLNSSFINATNMEEDIKNSYLGETLFIFSYGYECHEYNTAHQG